MIKGDFYAVGIGPGDPELLTIKAVKTIEKSDVIALPVSGGAKNIAYTIACEYIQDKELLYVDMPMIKDKTLLDEYHDNCANQIATYLDNGKSVAFLTLGDPAIYSTVMYIHKRLKDREYATNIIPGITSFSGVASALDETLCEKDEMLHIIPATFGDIDYALSLKGNKVLMKSGKSISDVLEKLKGKDAKVVECATMDNQKVYRNIDEIAEIPGYFSIIFVKG